MGRSLVLPPGGCGPEVCERPSGSPQGSNFLQELNQRLGCCWLFFHFYQGLMQLLILNLITAALVDNVCILFSSSNSVGRPHFWPHSSLLSHISSEAIGHTQKEEQERREEQAAAQARKQVRLACSERVACAPPCGGSLEVADLTGLFALLDESLPSETL